MLPEVPVCTYAGGFHSLRDAPKCTVKSVPVLYRQQRIEAVHMKISLPNWHKGVKIYKNKYNLK